MNETACRRLSIHGVVQGVGFRYSLHREAVRLELAGWVRNRRDGTVEAARLPLSFRRFRRVQAPRARP